ncbi:MAG: FecR domain-containing protein [Syntrophorhabdaceae bacterium]|nr:FecR domain-containing protein [Syntrophorhabdaceae bacterium]
MIKQGHVKKFLFFSLIFLFFIPLCTVYAAAGKIDNLSGSVFIRDKNNIPYRAAKKGDIFDKGYWIKTGGDGWVALTLADESKITLANNTELEITEFVIGKNRKNAVFSVTQGKLRASVTKLAGERVDYKVKSPTAVAGIKGTEFMMMTHGQANVFFGNEGKVDISGTQDRPKLLKADTMVQNTRGYVPIDPVEVKPDTPLHTAKENFKEITAATPPKDWEISNNLPHIIARWNINYGHYLADAGKYDEALHVFQIALDLTDKPDIRSDARLERGAVYSSFLNNPEAALSEYLLILEEYPNIVQREIALYNVGRTLYELGFKEQAKQRLLQYKTEYPTGRYSSNVETYLRTLGISQ